MLLTVQVKTSRYQACTHSGVVTEFAGFLIDLEKDKRTVVRTTVRLSSSIDLTSQNCITWMSWAYKGGLRRKEVPRKEMYPV